MNDHDLKKINEMFQHHTEKLILSLDAPSEEENLRFWVAEAEKRLKNLRDGKAQELSAEEAFREAKTRIS